MVCHGHMYDHVKRHKGPSANERKLLRNFYKLKGPHKKGHTNKSSENSLLTFRKPQPPKNVQDAMRIFQVIEKNVSPKYVAKQLKDAEYKLEKNMLI